MFFSKVVFCFWKFLIKWDIFIFIFIILDFCNNFFNCWVDFFMWELIIIIFGFLFLIYCFIFLVVIGWEFKVVREVKILVVLCNKNFLFWFVVVNKLLVNLFKFVWVFLFIMLYWLLVSFIKCFKLLEWMLLSVNFFIIFVLIWVWVFFFI